MLPPARAVRSYPVPTLSAAKPVVDHETKGPFRPNATTPEIPLQTDCSGMTKSQRVSPWRHDFCVKRALFFMQPVNLSERSGRVN